MAIRQEKSDARKQRISRDISLVRQNELKVHVERYNQHENQVYVQLKTMIKKMNVCMNDSEEISKHIEGFLAFTKIVLQFLGTYFLHYSLDLDETFTPKFVKLKNEKDCTEIADAIREKFDVVIVQLKANLDKFLKINESDMRSIKESNENVIKNCVPFKKGGNFSKKEIDYFRSVKMAIV